MNIQVNTGKDIIISSFLGSGMASHLEFTTRTLSIENSLHQSCESLLNTMLIILCDLRLF